MVGGGWCGVFLLNLVGFATITFLFQSLEILHKENIKRLDLIIRMIHKIMMVNILTTIMKVYIAQ